MATTTTLTPYTSSPSPAPKPSPQAAVAAATTPARPSPGSWHHPRAAEIARRTAASTFTESNLRRIVYNGLALTLLAYIHLTYIRPSSPSIYLSLPLAGTAALLAYNIFTALLPLLGPKDDLADIPLTPTQRALLGLEPGPAGTAATAGVAGTAGIAAITPPRYSLSASSSPLNLHRNNSRSGNGNGSGSASATGTPLSSSRYGMSDSVAARFGATNGSSNSLNTPAGFTDRGDSPVHSPLWVKTREMARGGSQGSFRSLRRGDSTASGGAVGGNQGQGIASGGEVRALMDVGRRRDSPGGGNGGRSSSVGLSSKWIYERESRRGSGGYA